METRGIRNNNPLNIRYVEGNKWEGRKPSKQDPEFEEFLTVFFGYRAAMKLIYNQITLQQRNTIQALISRWAPSNENNTENYIRIVCKRTGIGRDETLRFSCPGQIIEIVKAMAFVECGSVPNIDALHKAYRAVCSEKKLNVHLACLDRCYPIIQG